jgi:putative transposase
MARPTDSHITTALTSLLPRRRIRTLARRLGVVQRRRKLDIVALVYSLVLGFSVGERRTLSGLRRTYLRATGSRMAPSSFHARFTAPMTQLMRALLLEALEQLGRSRPRTRAVFAPFVEVLAVDAALIRLHNALESLYPSVFTHYMKASAKLCIVMNVVGRGAKTVKITHGSHHDVHLLQAGGWMKGRLLIFDLGFYRATLFREIDRHGGYFLSRMKKDGNPIVISSHRRRCRTGIKLRELQDEAIDDILDVEGQMVYQQRHEQRPFVTNHSIRWRCVAVYNAELEQWHRYVTNMPPQMMKAEHFTAVYAARWEVELLFRELKCTYRIEQMPSANRHVTETLIYAALLTLVLSRRLYRVLTRRWKLRSRRIPFDRWARLIATIAHDLLDVALDRHDRAYRQGRIERFLRAEAIDPNRARRHLVDKAQIGIYAPA